MSESQSDQTKVNRKYMVKCLKCGQYVRPDAEACPACGHFMAPRTMDADELAAAVQTVRLPTDKLPETGPDRRFEFLAATSALLQFLPTGACVSLTMDRPMVLGRGMSPDQNVMLDLTEFQGLLYGVSRQHCKLERRSNRLYVADLGSTNGTYVNEKRLVPFQDQVVGHGDRLVLGALNISIMFSSMG